MENSQLAPEMLVLVAFCFTLNWACNDGLSAPLFTKRSLPHTMTISAKVRDNVELDCSSDGNPQPDVLWYKYNISLLEITYRKLEDAFKYRKLLLNDLLLADAGNYSCLVNNTLGSINRTFILIICESSKSKPFILKSRLQNNTAVLGSEANFYCHVTSDSVTYIRWYFKRRAPRRNTSDNQTSPATVTEISSIVPVKIVTLLGRNGFSDLFKVDAVLLVKNVSLNDEGEYICEAFNQRGRVSWSAFLVVIQGPTASAGDLEPRYAALFGGTQEFSLAVLVAIPIALLIILTAVFIRALERAKQKHGVGQVKKTDVNGDASVISKSCNDTETANQKMEKKFVVTASRQTSNYTKRNGVKTGLQITELPKDMTSGATCSSERPLSSQVSDVSSKRCSEALELEWEGIELVMEEGFEMIKLCKEEEV